MGNNPSNAQTPASLSPSPAPESASEKPQLPPAVHQDDADEEDESVKQLGDCSSLYLSLQDCLVKTDRNWKACQKDFHVKFEGLDSIQPCSSSSRYPVNLQHERCKLSSHVMIGERVAMPAEELSVQRRS
ncbi:hypothetical protein AKJ16_DCAP13469 [Drosera capensis]